MFNLTENDYKINKLIYDNLPKIGDKYLKTDKVEIKKSDIEIITTIDNFKILLTNNGINFIEDTNYITLNNVTWRQHEIQQRLMKNFLNDKKELYKYDKTNKKEKVNKPNGIANIMYDTYIFENPNIFINSIEKFYSKIESKFTIKIEELEKNIQKNNFVKIKRNIENLILDYLCFYYRSPAIINGYCENKLDNFTVSNHVLYNLTCGKWSSIDDLAKLINTHYRIAILENPDEDFVLSDNFISTCALAAKDYYFDISNREIGQKETMLLFPLSSKYYILLWNSNFFNEFKSNQINKLTNEQKNKINKIIFLNSYKYCICSNKDTLKSLEKFEDNIGYEYRKIKQSNYTEFYNVKKEIFYYEDEIEVYKNNKILCEISEGLTDPKTVNLLDLKINGRYKNKIDARIKDDNYTIKISDYIQYPVLEHPLFIKKIKNKLF